MPRGGGWHLQLARPGPTRPSTLPSTFQALPLVAQQDSRDSIRIQTNTLLIDISVCMQYLSINTMTYEMYMPLSSDKIY